MQPLKAGPGKHIIAELITAGETERLEFDIVPDAYADFEQGFLGAGTPLARAVSGLTAGQEKPYRAGDVTAVRVIGVSPSSTPPPKEVAARREEAYRKAVEESDRTNAMIFASSFSGKWGDYDPTGFIEDSEEDSNEGGEIKKP